MLARFRSTAAVIALALLALVAAEATARVDDWIRYDMPILGTPDQVVDLQVTDTLGVRGRPNGRHLRFRLNNLGFRSGDVAETPRPGCTRVLVLGASETFGPTEPVGDEYPAQLARRLAGDGCYEVLNAGIPGMGLRQITYTWNEYWSRLRPDLVLVYPTPAFYLGAERPEWPDRDWLAQRSDDPVPARPRLFFRAKEAIEFPAAIQRRRVERRIARALEGIPADSLWRAVPVERLRLFEQDLDSLARAIAARGATPVLMTHAHRFGDTPHPDDADIMTAWRSYAPRALPATILAFEASAAQATRDVARRHGFPLADVACALTGRRERFADFAHFTSEGAATVAAVAARAVVPPTAARPIAEGGDDRCTRQDPPRARLTAASAEGAGGG